MTDCVFCGIVAGTQPSVMVREWRDAVAFRPLNPVCDGHTLVVPRQHVRDAVENAAVTALTMGRAAELAGEWAASNILTSVGAAATQSVHHLHVHIVPRSAGDGLMLPWGTTGDPHEPHRCPGMDVLTAELVAVTAPTAAGQALNVVWGRPPEQPVRYVPIPLEPPTAPEGTDADDPKDGETMTDCLHVNWFARDPGGSTTYTTPTCCDMHGRTCEPPSELCCDHCTEAVHQMGDAAVGVHLRDGTRCSNPDLSGSQAARGQFVPVPDEGQLSVMRTPQ